MLSREDSIYFAKLAEQAERYEDMVKRMKEVVASDQELNTEERNLLSVAYKNSVGARRTAWRSVSAIEAKEKQRNSAHISTVTEYKQRIEKELNSICEDVLNLLDETLIPNTNGVEPTIFYLKMKGDYFRYLAEFYKGNDHKEVIDKAQDAYKEATDAAMPLKATHPIRLGLALNYSVFYYEIVESPEIACKHAKTAFDSAIAELDALEEEEYRDSAAIMQLLRDNLTLWTTDMENKDKEGDKNEKNVEEET